MREKLTVGLVIFGLVLYVSVVLVGLLFMVAEMTGQAFQPWAVLLAVALFWLVVGGSEFGSWLYQKCKNPRKQ